MPTVAGKQFPYTDAGKAAAKAARAKAKTNPAKPVRAGQPPRLKSDLMKGGYNIARNLGQDNIPDIGY